jgi:hypothetical protein
MTLLRWTAVAHVIAFLLLIPLAFLDPQTILGVSRWVKPMKFAVSIVVFTATMTWLLAKLRDSDRAVERIATIISATMTLEFALLIMQATRGVRSHFNVDTPFDGAVFTAMGLAIVANTAAVCWATWLYFRRPSTMRGAVLTGIRAGLVLFILASLQGFTMIALKGHSVGVHDGGPGLLFVNWSTRGGDLRIAHFFGMHALQGLPLLGLVLDRLRVPRSDRWVTIAALLWTTITALLVVQAFAGQPLLQVG